MILDVFVITIEVASIIFDYDFQRYQDHDDDLKHL